MSSGRVPRNPADRRQAARLGVGLDTPQAQQLRLTPRLPAKLVRLHVPTPLLAHRFAYNPSVAVFEDQLRVTLRLSQMWGPDTVLCVARLDDDWHLWDHKIIDRHIEDCRLFAWRGGLWASGTVLRHGVGRHLPVHLDSSIHLVRLSSDGARIEEEHQLPSAGPVEKNWMPVVRGDDLSWVYGTRPLVVVSYTDCRPQRIAQPFDLRGGSQLVRHPKLPGYLALVHEQHKAAGLAYVHRFVWFSPDLRDARVGPRFVFQQVGVEFAAGLAYWGGQWVVTFGAGDCEAWVALVDDATVRAQLREAP